MDSLAITDHGVMYGVIDFYRAAKEAKLNRRSSAARFMWRRDRGLTENVNGKTGIIIEILLAEK